jgi:hypothetical protein
MHESPELYQYLMRRQYAQVPLYESSHMHREQKMWKQLSTPLVHVPQPS